MKKLLGFLAFGLFSANLMATATTTFVCSYPSYSNEEGNHRTKGQFTLTFVVDSSKGTAYVIGEEGSAEVKMIAEKDAVTFIEVTPGGNVMTTTITANGQSVHSRNTVIAGKIVPSQNYGHCVMR